MIFNIDFHWLKISHSSIIEKTPNNNTKIPPSIIALDIIPIVNCDKLKNLK